MVNMNTSAGGNHQTVNEAYPAAQLEHRSCHLTDRTDSYLIYMTSNAARPNVTLVYIILQRAGSLQFHFDLMYEQSELCVTSLNDDMGWGPEGWPTCFDTAKGQTSFLNCWGEAVYRQHEKSDDTCMATDIQVKCWPIFRSNIKKEIKVKLR